MWKPFSRKGEGSSATNRILSLSSEGFSQSDIIDTLRKEGFAPEQVDRSMREAMRITATAEAAPQPMPSQPALRPQPQPKARSMPVPVPVESETLPERPPRGLEHIELPEVGRIAPPSMEPPPKPSSYDERFTPRSYSGAEAPEPPLSRESFEQYIEKKPESSRRPRLGELTPEEELDEEPEGPEDEEFPKELQEEPTEDLEYPSMPKKPRPIKPNEPLDEEEELGPDEEPGPEEDLVPDKEEPEPEPEEDFDVPEGPEEPEPEVELPPSRPLRPKPPSYDRPISTGRPEGRDRTEEMVETVVEEKWEGFRKEIDFLSDEVREINLKIGQIQSALSGGGLGGKQANVPELRKILQEYKEGIDDLSSRIEAVEKAMKDSLMLVLESVRSLSDAVSAIKEKKASS